LKKVVKVYEERKKRIIETKKAMEDADPVLAQWNKFNDEERQGLARLAMQQLKSKVAIDNMSKALNKYSNAQDKVDKPKSVKE
jgi:hypothetical protein